MCQHEQPAKTPWAFCRFPVCMQAYLCKAPSKGSARALRKGPFAFCVMYVLSGMVLTVSCS